MLARGEAQPKAQRNPGKATEGIEALEGRQNPSPSALSPLQGLRHVPRVLGVALAKPRSTPRANIGRPSAAKLGQLL